MSYLPNFLGGRRQSNTQTLFIQTATGTVTNTVTETEITSTGVGSLVLPENFFVAGRTLVIYGKGLHSSPGGAQIRIRVKLGSTTILDTGSVNSGNDTDAQFNISAIVTCRTTGGSGTVFSQGDYAEDGSSPTIFEMVNTAATTVDTTASQTLSITAEWDSASASRSISLTNLVVECINP